jgi:hypothetical protein
MKFGPRKPIVRVANHQSGAVRKGSGRAIEHVSDAKMQQGWL